MKCVSRFNRTSKSSQVSLRVVDSWTVCPNCNKITYEVKAFLTCEFLLILKTNDNQRITLNFSTIGLFTSDFICCVLTMCSLLFL